MFWKRSARPFTVRFGACSHVGQVRTENQDAYGHFPDQEAPDENDRHLFIVADGMGGHEDGGQASRVTVEVVGETYFAQEAGTPIEASLGQALSAANDRVYEWAHAGGVPKKMGTTCTALALVDGKAWLAHVGDSRAYRIDRSGISQLTQDHTLVGALQREGVLTEAEAERHPQRHALIRAIGVEPTVDVDVKQVEALQAGDVFVLCSDGLAHVTNEEIRDVVRGEAVQAAAERLVAMANDRGGQDNVTVLVVEVQ